MYQTLNLDFFFIYIGPVDTKGKELFKTFRMRLKLPNIKIDKPHDIEEKIHERSRLKKFLNFFKFRALSKRSSKDSPIIVTEDSRSPQINFDKPVTMVTFPEDEPQDGDSEPGHDTSLQESNSLLDKDVDSEGELTEQENEPSNDTTGNDNNVLPDIELASAQNVSKLVQDVVGQIQDVTESGQDVADQAQDGAESIKDAANQAQDGVKQTQEIEKVDKDVADQIQNVANPVQDVAEITAEVVKPVPDVADQVQDVVKQAQNVRIPVQDGPGPFQGVAELSRYAAEPTQDGGGPAQGDAKPAQNAVEPAQNVADQAKNGAEPVQNDPNNNLFERIEEKIASSNRKERRRLAPITRPAVNPNGLNVEYSIYDNKFYRGDLVPRVERPVTPRPATPRLCKDPQEARKDLSDGVIQEKQNKADDLRSEAIAKRLQYIADRHQRFERRKSLLAEKRRARIQSRNDRAEKVSDTKAKRDAERAEVRSRLLFVHL